MTNSCSLIFGDAKESKKLNQHDKKYMTWASVQDMPASGSHRPNDTGLIQPFSQGDIFF
jgi:hypothetical protein